MATDTLQSDSKPITATFQRTKPRRSVKPAAVKAAIIAKRANGETTTKIAKDLGITRNTTRAIIEESSIDRLIESGEIGTAQLIHKSLNVIENRLDKQSESAACFILSNTVFSERYSKKAAPPADVVVNLAIQNLINPPATSNSALPANDKPETSSNPQVIDCTPPSKT